MIRAYQHHCGGWYAASEDRDGSHHQPPFCACPGWGRCYESAEIAIAVARGEMDGDHPAGSARRFPDDDGRWDSPL